ncbi:uncharacterized protein V1513DRAFT_150753 [Lipomyces chichibuensis]|uniref:uncharacterized protein n=1 Tax=Lipomyces chichibuensis TaxID=1546026 RepID=UPI003342F738
MSYIAPPLRPTILPPRADSKTFQSSLQSCRSAVSMHTTTSVKRTKSAPRSRNGCWTCRNRKVKCDEAQPKCTPCTRLGVVCDYTRQISYKDDTPKILRKMAKLIDTAGCPVYDPTAKKIFQPYHHYLERDYEEEHDNGFVVHCISDYVPYSPSSSTGDSNMSRAHRLGSRASGGSDPDGDGDWDEDEDEDNEEYYHKSRRSRTVQDDLTSHNVARSLSQLWPRLVQPISAHTREVKFAFDICVSTTPRRSQFPPPEDFGVTDGTLRTERHNESSPSLNEAKCDTPCYYSSAQGQEHSLDHQSSYSRQAITPDWSSSSSTRSSLSMPPFSLPDTYHEHSTISIASEPGENMRSFNTSVNHMFMHVLPTAWSQHHLPQHQPQHNAQDQAPYQPFKSEPGDFSGLVEEEDNVLLYYLRQCYSRTDSATTIASTTSRNEQQNSLPLIFPIGQQLSLPEFPHHSAFHPSFWT